MGGKTDLLPSLAGTQFTIRYYDGYYTKDNLPSTPTKTWVIEVREISGMYLTMLSDPYLVHSMGDDLYYSENGIPILPLGTVTIQETKPAAGYTLDGYLKDWNGNVISTDSEILVTQIKNAGDMTAMEAGNEFTGENTPKLTYVRLMKYQEDGKTPLAGVTFELSNKDGEVIATATTDSTGVAEFKDLYPDVYYVTEVETAEDPAKKAEGLGPAGVGSL